MEIVMPKMGESVNEGTIIKWYKKIGDKVKRDEVIFEISTDKVDTEIPSPATGTITDIKVNEGDTVEVGTVVAVLETNGEAGPGKKESSTTGIQKSSEVASIDENVDAEKQAAAANGILEVAMPKMGESVMEGTVIKWFKKVGDKIDRDEPLFEISTDKVDTEVPSPVAGTVAEILVAEQETVDVGTIVVKIAAEGGTEVQQSSPQETVRQVEEQAAAAVSMHDNFSGARLGIKQENVKSNRFYSPLVLNISQKENISFAELENILGTGLNGRVSKKDILSYIEKRKAGKVKVPAQKQAVAQTYTPSESAVIPVSGEVEKIPMDNIRLKIMEHMVASRDTSVHVTSMVEVDMTKIDNFIRENKDEYFNRDGVKLTYMAFVADACVKALKAYPLVNSSIEGTTIIRKKYINIGIAVAVEPTGLIVPNIKSADQRNITGLAAAISDLAYRARNKKLTPDDISGGTFTITNFGVFGTVFGLPIINQPEVAILGVGAAIKRPVVVEVDGTDAITIRPIMALTLSHDHRLIDGMLGSLFLKYVKETLENFNPISV
ncbi:MAG TPA: 2-oxoglutarate dehydrogenase, E2 component, dihydrolipoamide succinyltransferase [Ignavibacteriales bacterium]|nr:2-oxoglutarate dehydrogenase, E2 component, dihydrolipoamide succinyltransferase [Ignavibacteriales bacterium]